MSIRISCSQLLRNFIYENCFSAFWFFRSISECLLGLDHGLDTVVHILNEIFLRTSETSLVRDIVSSVIRFGVLSMDTTDLDVILISNSLELVHLFAEFW